MNNYSTNIQIPLKKINEYNVSLKQSCFDPTKHSPPNVFISKLEGRYNNYYNQPVILNN